MHGKLSFAYIVEQIGRTFFLPRPCHSISCFLNAAAAACTD